MISVIIPTYKEPEYLDLCITSAIEGQINNNEIIVVVDGHYDINKDVLTKHHKNISIFNFDTNQGLSIATNWGVYNATNDNILVVNDDNVFPNKWDIGIEKYIVKNRIISPNQIEPSSSIFKQFHIKNLGNSSSEFSLEEFWKYEDSLPVQEYDFTGSTLPFAMKRLDYLAVGGWDIMYPSPHVVDWDFFAKCEYLGFDMVRVYKHFYHFAGMATRKTPEQDRISIEKEHQAHLFFEAKWGERAQHNRETNSKALSIF